MLGDSLSAGYGLAHDDGFEAELGRRFPQITIIDAAVSGDTTAGGLARLDWALAERFYADKVATMKRFAEWWDRICLAYGGASQQAAAQQRRHPRTPVEAKSARVTYSSDVVQITAAT